MPPSPTDRRTSVYLAGPMRGYPLFNFPAFEEAERDLVQRGFDVWSPARHDLDNGFDPEHDDALPLAEYMKTDLRQVLRSDALVVLPGWEESEGAGLEVHAALACGIPVWAYPNLEPVDAVFAPTFRRPVSVVDELPDGVLYAGPALAKHPSGDAVDTWTPENVSKASGLFEPFEHQKAFYADRAQRIVTNAVTGGQKETRPARFDLLPWDQLWRVAELYGYGASKYEDRNWERGYAFSLSIAALHRHLAKFVQGESYDTESGQHHLASVVFHALALMRFEQEVDAGKLPADLDDRAVAA